MTHSSKRDPIYVIGPSILYVPLTQGQFSVIDVDDAILLGSHSWYANYDPTTDGFYACSKIMGKRVRLHRLIKPHGEGVTVDHIRCTDTLDNRKANLRHADAQTQALNRRMQRNNSSGAKGVYRRVRPSGNVIWEVQRRINKRIVQIGCFNSFDEAVTASNEAYSCPNPPPLPFRNLSPEQAAELARQATEDWLREMSEGC